MMTQEFDIAIVGGGPTGLVLANLLGALGVSTVLIEREKEVYPIPRATHIDEETLRNLALTGLMEQLRPFVSPFGSMEVARTNGRSIIKEPVGLDIPIHGRQGSYFFDQPALERVLRNGLQRYACVHTEYGVQVEELTMNADAVRLSARDNTTGQIASFQAHYVIGCDGAKSFVRNALGISMQEMAPASQWLIVDAVLKNPADAQLLPSHFQYRMGLGRLQLYAHGHGLHRRWEFRLANDTPRPSGAEVMRWISAYIDPELLDISRTSTYSHRALDCTAWRKGRVLLAGDAAHLMPPTAGQGMCSGIRDAVNLAWKLQLSLQHNASPALLDTYAQERKPHLASTLQTALFLSSRLDAHTALGRWFRYIQLLAVGKLPMLREVLRNQVLRSIPLKNGMFDTSLGGGQHLPSFEAGDRATDSLWPYGWAVVACRDDFGPTLALRLEQMNIAAIGCRPQHAPYSDALCAWLKDRHATYAIVRPDRIVYALSDAASIHGHLDMLQRSGVSTAVSTKNEFSLNGII
jgi:3-(3-hydroxy-phenyl)propionate hydroxylase